MKTTFKFLGAIFVFAFSVVAYSSLEAQSKYLTDEKRPPVKFEVTIEVTKVAIGEFNLEAIARYTGDKGVMPAYEVNWYRYGKYFSNRWSVEGVGYGVYTAVVTDLNTGGWAEASVRLFPYAVLPHVTSYYK